MATRRRRTYGALTMTRPAPLPLRPLRVLVAGGGVAAIEAVLALHALAGGSRRDRTARPRRGLRGAAVVGALTVRREGARAGAAGPARCSSGSCATAARSARSTCRRHEVRTTDGVRLGYDRLIVATGARSVDGVPGATTFRGPLSAGAVEGALRAARERVLFTLPAGAGWTLPLYELALLTAHELPAGPELTVVTPEPRPLDIFGPVASDALARLLDRAGIGFEGDTVAEAVVGGALATRDGRLIGADAVIALARLRGPHIAGLPATAEGFLDVDAHGRVTGARDVFAAGDVDGRAGQAGRARRPAGRRRRRGDRRRGRRPRRRRVRAVACCAASSSPARRRCSCAATSTTTMRSPARCAARPKASRAPSSGGPPASSPAAT